MKTTLLLACVWVAVLGIMLWPGTSAPHLVAGDAKGKQGVDAPKDDPFLQAIQKRFGKPDRVTGSGRAFLHYDLSNGDTLTFVVSGAKLLGIEHKTKQPTGDLSDAIQSRLGKPDHVAGSGRAFLRYDLSTGDTVTLVVSDGRVLNANQPALDAPKAKDPEDVLFPLPPQEVAAGKFEQWQRDAAKKPSSVTYTRVEYDRKAYWVVEASFGYGDPSTKIAIYAPTKEGSFRRCLLAGPIKAATLAVAVDAKTGLLNLTEEARSGTKGEVVLSCNLKVIGANTDLELLQGTWNIDTMEWGGKNLPKELMNGYKFVFAGNKLTWHAAIGMQSKGGKITAMDGTYPCDFKIDPGKEPKQIDITLHLKKGDRTILGIYEIKGDTLKLCCAGSITGKRPAEFSTKDDGNISYIVLTRAKK